MSHSGSSSSRFCQRIGVTATQVLPYRPILSRHYAGMTQDGLLIAGTLGGGGVASNTLRHTCIRIYVTSFKDRTSPDPLPPPHSHTPTLTRVTGQWAEHRALVLVRRQQGLRGQRAHHCVRAQHGVGCEKTSTGFCWGSRAVISLEVTMTVSAGGPIFCFVVLLKSL